VVSVSSYQLHRCVWDYLRAGEVKSNSNSNSSGKFDDSKYELTGEERTAFEGKDVAGLYRLGLHPVLLNAFCRAAGYSRDDYRKVLAVFAVPEERIGRWQK
jgi:hypothetical protein